MALILHRYTKVNNEWWLLAVFEEEGQTDIVHAISFDGIQHKGYPVDAGSRSR